MSGVVSRMERSAAQQKGLCLLTLQIGRKQTGLQVPVAFSLSSPPLPPTIAKRQVPIRAVRFRCASFEFLTASCSVLGVHSFPGRTAGPAKHLVVVAAIEGPVCQ
ncbi:hypothetical protein BaRGS_00032045 [Batillaria attramentaria]|uniref:Uncharacterized protein n=1 Tax=Batillaria attramentaria TaxID=370345 RepID=A0ABD0JNR6_9CAEN